ncbi:AraC family transcriptional regulator [Chlorogloeopsis fritschii]|uniref:AraC family transcriptional regulator n=1 Tax=Chlorogloeopsis fritschii TaxID=1124 RepID=UPI0023F48BBB|nr:AraC family transcriptional regulator [Chlorogloeopsis fritschii]
MMMSESNSLITFEPTSDDSCREVFSRSPILSSSDVGWNSIDLSYHLLPAAHETPEFFNTRHMVVIQTPVLSLVKLERKLNNRWRNESFKQGDSIVYPANVPRLERWHHKARKEWGSINLCFEPNLVATIAREVVDPDRVELISPAPQPDPLIEHIGLTLKTELESDAAGSYLYAESAATLLSVHLLKKYSTLQPNLPEYQDGLPQHYLKQVIDYIHAHLDENIRLAELANLANMSQYYFCRLFKQSMGISPHHYLIQQRVERAKQLLKLQGWTIADIALECGFYNQTHLTKHFRQMTGTTPKAYVIACR